jgi:hypothetical protein
MSSGKWAMIALVAIVVAFGAGYLTAHFPARQATRALESEVEAAEAETQETQAALQQAQLELGMAELLGKLGQIFIDVNNNNFGIAADKVTPFFDGLTTYLDASPSLSESKLQALRAISARRDEIVTDLARANPQVREKVGEMFLLLHSQLSD